MKSRHVRQVQILAVLVIILAAILLFAASATTLHAQKYTDLHNLGSMSGDPANPAWMGLFAQGRDGNLYSTSQGGGVPVKGVQYGAVFRLTPTGKMTVLYSFQNKADGVFPNGGLTLGTDGDLYGTTPAGGSTGFGTVFKVTTSGKFTLLHTFNGSPEGVQAYAPPIQGPDGNFYGTTSNGGGPVFGTVYKMTPSGKLTVIYSFPGNSKLSYPLALTLGTDGNFYGTALGGIGTSRYGGVFKITPHGTLAVLYRFNGAPDGQSALGAIIQASDGNFYGTTNGGGAGGVGAIYKMTPAGALTIIRSFNETDGMGIHPRAGLVQATDGKFYGAATSNPSTLFQITSKDKYTTLVVFTNNIGKYLGQNPQVSLFQHTNGTLYGDTDSGGTGKLCACGVLYSLSMKVGPFVSFVGPLFSGKVGKTIEILGQGFTGTTKVSFHGVSVTTFTVVSDTYLTAVVPAGATTGSVTVTTPGGTLTSNKIFRVTPAIMSFSPTSGPVGTSVMITGTSFTGSTKVTFGGVKATDFTVNSDTKVTATVPSGAKTGKIAITTAGGTAASSGTFTVTPFIKSFKPTSGPVGTLVTITGTSFTGATSVTFNGVSAQFTVKTDTQVTATVPAGATTGRIQVTTPGGTATSATDFTVT